MTDQTQPEIMEVQLKNKSKFNKMIILGYCISFLALMNAAAAPKSVA